MRTYPFIKGFYHKSTSQTKNYPDRLNAFIHALERADRVVIGAGAGLSAAAGLEYGGNRFVNNFGDFICRYAIPDMYAAMFYPFDTEEERWAYLARHIRLNRYDNELAYPLYRQLLQTIGSKDYFVITTNVDGLFKKMVLPQTEFLKYKVTMLICNVLRDAMTRFITMKSLSARCQN